MTPWYVPDFVEMRAISKFTYAMVSFSHVDNITVISMLWELLHRNIIVSHNMIQSTLKGQTNPLHQHEYVHDIYFMGKPDIMEK